MRKSIATFLPLAVLLLLAAASAPYAPAQVGTQTTILANPDGPWFTVDGTVYTAPMSAFWPVGSIHQLGIPQGTGFSYNYGSTIQYLFSSWSVGNSSFNGTGLQVVASTAITRITANFSALYLLTLQVACSTGPCPYPPGAIAIDGAVPQSTTIWEAPNSTHTLQAAFGTDWVFAGWQTGTTPGYTSTEPVESVTMNTPLTITAVFAPAKLINFQTVPSNLEVYADGVLINTPSTLNWGMGTSHMISALPVQQDGVGNRWVSGTWSDGGASTHAYVVGTKPTPETITETYLAAAYPIFDTSPPLLNMVVDNLLLPPPYSYIWGVGTTHTVTATSPQTDSQGKTWVFQKWDDQVTTPTRTITIPLDAAPPNGYSRVAFYAQQTPVKLTVTSSIAGQVVTVDGSPCATPCTVTRNSGTQVHVSAPASVPVNGTSRQDLLGWSANGSAPVAGDWIATLNADTAVAASYHLMNLLSTTLNPPSSARWNLTPASSDGYYDSQTTVQVAVTPRLGYRFGGWSGDLSGTAPIGNLAMSQPHQVVAELKAAPHISSGGLGNGAGAGERPGVAPGSVASIFGVNLAKTAAAGPSSPLERTLAGVTLHLGARQLPLYFVSPTQINLQIPPDLEPGAHTVTISVEDMPDVDYEFQVVRDAPGVFPAADVPTHALVLHEDGSAVTASAPAQRGELLSLYGTGFGPTNLPRPEGDRVPAKPAYTLLDRVSVRVGDSVLASEAAFAAPGQVGMDVVQFRLDGGAPAGDAIPVSVSVNGVTSNILALPIR